MQSDAEVDQEHAADHVVDEDRGLAPQRAHLEAPLEHDHQEPDDREHDDRELPRPRELRIDVGAASGAVGDRHGVGAYIT